MGDGGELAELGGAGNEPVEASEPAVDAGAQAIDRIAVGEVHGQQRGLPAHFAHPIVGLLEAALGAGQQYEMGAFAREQRRHRGSEPSAGAGDQDDVVGERAHVTTSSWRKESWASRRPSSQSRRRTG